MNIRMLSAEVGIDLENACLDFLHNALRHVSFIANGKSHLCEELKSYVESRTFNCTHDLVVIEYHHPDREHARMFISTTEEKVMDKIAQWHGECHTMHIKRKENVSITVRGRRDKLLIVDDLYYVDEKGYLHYEEWSESLLPLGLEECLGYVFQPPFHYVASTNRQNGNRYDRTNRLCGIDHEEFLLRLSCRYRENEEPLHVFEHYKSKMLDMKQRVQEALNAAGVNATFKPMTVTEESYENGKIVIKDKHELVSHERLIVGKDEERQGYVVSYLTGNVYLKGQKRGTRILFQELPETFGRLYGNQKQLKEGSL